MKEMKCCEYGTWFYYCYIIYHRKKFYSTGPWLIFYSLNAPVVTVMNIASHTSYIHTHTCIHTYIHLCICVHIYNMYICTHIHTHIYICIYTCMYIYIYICIHAFLYMCTYTHAHTRAHTRAHTHTHTHKYAIRMYT
jgi:hypothetical protein